MTGYQSHDQGGRFIVEFAHDIAQDARPKHHPCVEQGEGNFGIDIFTKCKYTKAMKFEWDEEKRLANVVKHGVDFTDACRLFEGPFMIMTDNRRDYGEIRSIAFGHVESRLIVVAFTKRQDIIRIISARKANDREKKRFKEAIADRLETDRFHEG